MGIPGQVIAVGFPYIAIRPLFRPACLFCGRKYPFYTSEKAISGKGHMARPGNWRRDSYDCLARHTDHVPSLPFRILWILRGITRIFAHKIDKNNRKGRAERKNQRRLIMLIGVRKDRISRLVVLEFLDCRCVFGEFKLWGNPGTRVRNPENGEFVGFR